ncbi:MAG TPA: penicillin acylase family protein [Steroidobacteraceae bacterium]|nr:penicillin acylase family protein [Steroidobacteraceae bacterium]
MRWLRWLRWTLGFIVVCAALAFGLAWWALRQSLPQIEGTAKAPALGAEAIIERDARGVPVISAATRADLAYALGYAHAQDRFFQMDLSRRLAAGELSELFGQLAIKQDIRTRRFGFRAVARRVIERAPEAERAIVEAYSNGVNAGLVSLRARPWEYLLLRAQPRAWLPEDSVLVVHSMWWQLQYGTLRDEIARRRLERASAARSEPKAAHDLIAFVYAGHSDWDTPNYSADSRCVQAACTDAASVLTQPFPAQLRFNGVADEAGGEPAAPGSNNWAVAGVHTRSGVALIANDMHLDLGVPAVWYPARLLVTGGPSVDITGVTLPGTPAVAAGSNGMVAWGFTNSYGDFADARWGKCENADHRVRQESIAVKGGDAREVTYRDIGEGVVLDGEEFADDVASGDCLQVAWLATRPEATNFGLLALEGARSIDDVVALAPHVGIPGQNMVVGDTRGRIAWTLLGRVPGTRGPDRLFGPLEYLDAVDHPRISDPPVGRLWTANQRVVAGPLEAVLGDDEVDVGAGGYDIGARARQIRDGLLSLAQPATEADMLAIQLDSRALFVARWRDLLLALIDEDAMNGADLRREFRALVSDGAPQAAPEAVGYRLVRTFRTNTLNAMWHSLSTGLLGEEIGIRRPGQFEAAGWRLVNERPSAVEPPGGGEWRAFLLQRVDATIAELLKDCGSLASCEYGRMEPVAVRHPLSGALPLLPKLLDMPIRALAGDHHMPRVQDGSFGASERFAVSPGRERDGYLELPGGPSGHPLSPFYRSGFEDWAKGVPTPFLPGSVAHRLALRP